MKRAAKRAGILAVMMMCVFMLSMSAQAKQSSQKKIEKKIKASVTQLQSGFKSRKQKTMKKALVSPKNTSIGTGYNKRYYLDKYFKNAHKKVRLKAVGIAIDGNTATVVVRAKYVSCQDAWLSVWDTVAKNRLSTASSSLSPVFQGAVAAHPGVTVSKDVTVQFVKAGSKWKFNCNDAATCTFIDNLYLSDAYAALDAYKASLK